MGFGVRVTTAHRRMSVASCFSPLPPLAAAALTPSSAANAEIKLVPIRQRARATCAFGLGSERQREDAILRYELLDSCDLSPIGLSPI